VLCTGNINGWFSCRAVPAGTHGLPRYRSRNVIDIRLMGRRSERPRRSASWLGRSRPRNGPAYQVHGDPTYLIAADPDVRPKRADA